MATLTEDQAQEIRHELEHILTSLNTKNPTQGGFTDEDGKAGKVFRKLMEAFLTKKDPFCSCSALGLSKGQAKAQISLLRDYLAPYGEYYREGWKRVSVRHIHEHPQGKGYALAVYCGEDPISKGAKGIDSIHGIFEELFSGLRLGEQRDISALLSQLDSGTPKEVIQAIDQLTELEPSRAVPRLLETINTHMETFAPDIRARVKAKFAQWKTHTNTQLPRDLERRTTIAQAKKLLASSHITQIAKGATQLAEIGAIELETRALNALSDYPSVDLIGAALHAVTEIDHPTRHKKLLDLLEKAAQLWQGTQKTHHITVVLYLIAAIYKLSTRETSLALFAYAKDHRLPSAGRRLILFTQAHPGNTEVVETLLEIFRTDPDIQGEAGLTLATIGDPRALPAMLEALQQGPETFPLYGSLTANRILRHLARSTKPMLIPLRKTVLSLEEIFRRTASPQVKAVALYAASPGRASRKFITEIYESLPEYKGDTLYSPKPDRGTRFLLLAKIWFLGLQRDTPGSAPLISLFKHYLRRDISSEEASLEVEVDATALAIGRIGGPDAAAFLRRFVFCRRDFGPWQLPVNEGTLYRSRVENLGLLLAQCRMGIDRADLKLEDQIEVMQSWNRRARALHFLWFEKKEAGWSQRRLAGLWETFLDGLTVRHILEGLFQAPFDIWETNPVAHLDACLPDMPEERQGRKSRFDEEEDDEGLGSPEDMLHAILGH